MECFKPTSNGFCCLLLGISSMSLVRTHAFAPFNGLNSDGKRAEGVKGVAGEEDTTVGGIYMLMRCAQSLSGQHNAFRRGPSSPTSSSSSLM